MGKEALLAMMFYGMTQLGLTSITAKIGYSNVSSQALYAKLGFEEVFEKWGVQRNNTGTKVNWH